MMTREAKAAWARNRRRQLAYGTWQPTQQLDPQPVRDHINNLRRFGLSIHTIGKLAGESRGALSQIIYPNHCDYLTWITPERAARILAVKFDLDAIPDGRNVNAAGTRRRLEALMSLGWSQGHIADVLGVSRQRVSTYRRSAHVEGATARAVRDLYEQWWDKRGPEVRAVNKALREGFAPPAAWDDDTIDDPAATPDVGDTPDRVNGGTGRRSTDVAEDVEWLLSLDPTLTTTHLAHRLGYADNSGITNALGKDRANRPDLLAVLARNAELSGANVRRAS